MFAHVISTLNFTFTLHVFYISIIMIYLNEIQFTKCIIECVLFVFSFLVGSSWFQHTALSEASFLCNINSQQQRIALENTLNPLVNTSFWNNKSYDESSSHWCHRLTSISAFMNILLLPTLNSIENAIYIELSLA